MKIYKPNNIQYICSILLISVFIFTGCTTNTNTSMNNTVSETTTATPTTESTTEKQKSNLLGDQFAKAGKGNEENLLYDISPKAQLFLNKHPELYPAKNFEAVDSYIDISVGYKYVAKNPNRYGDKVMMVESCNIVQITEDEKIIKILS